MEERDKQIGAIIAGIQRLEQGTHMRRLVWFLAILTVTNVIIAVTQVLLLVRTLHR